MDLLLDDVLINGILDSGSNVSLTRKVFFLSILQREASSWKMLTAGWPWKLRNYSKIDAYLSGRPVLIAIP